MTTEDGRAWRLGCAPERYRPHDPSEQIAAVAPALIATSRAAAAK